MVFQYYNEIPLGKSTAIDHITWKSEQHRLTPKYDILRSLVPLVKHYFVTMVEDDNQLKMTFQRCNGFVTCKGRSEYIIYINFIHSGLSTLGLYPEYIDL